MWHQINSFLQEHALALAVLTILIAAGRMVYDTVQSRKERKKWREVPLINWNDQGMATITNKAVTATPINNHHLEQVGRFFPHDLQGFIANLSPGELATILVEVTTNSNQMADERKKDILRAVTIAAARFGFMIPIPLVCLDARTHALYVVLSNQLDMCKVSLNMIVKSGGPEPTENYLRVFAVAGHVLMHYAAKGPYPSVTNFIKTVNRNLRGASQLSDDSLLAVVTAYAGLTNMPLPHSYHRYNELTDAVYYSSRVQKVMEQEKPKLTLVK
jgi:hypothetical protein